MLSWVCTCTENDSPNGAFILRLIMATAGEKQRQSCARASVRRCSCWHVEFKYIWSPARKHVTPTRQTLQWFVLCLWLISLLLTNENKMFILLFHNLQITRKISSPCDRKTIICSHRKPSGDNCSFSTRQTFCLFCFCNVCEWKTKFSICEERRGI